MEFTVSTKGLHYEQMNYSLGTPPSFIPFTMSNIRTDDKPVTVKVQLYTLPNAEFPASFKLFDMAEFGINAIKDVDVSSLETLMMDPLAQQDDIFVQPGETKTILAVLLPCFPTGPNAQSSYERTSFFNVTARLILQSETEGGDSIVQLPISAMFCTPILYVDETDIDFEQCSIGETYVRDIQVWNRSECALSFRVVPFTDGNASLLAFQDFDSGRNIPYAVPQHIASFASKRIRLLFRASLLGDSKVLLHVENIKNPLNKVPLECRLNVIAVDESDILVQDVITGSSVGAGRVLHFGDCYYSLDTLRSARVTNNSQHTVQLLVRSENPSEILFDVDFEEKKLDVRRTASSGLSELSRDLKSVVSTTDSDRAAPVCRELALTKYGGRTAQSDHFQYTRNDWSAHGQGGHDDVDGVLDEDAKAEADAESKADEALQRRTRQKIPRALDTWTISNKQHMDKVKLHSSCDVAAYFARSGCSSFGELPHGNAMALLTSNPHSSYPIKNESKISTKPSQQSMSASMITVGQESHRDQFCASKVVTLPPGASMTIVLCFSPRQTRQRDKESSAKSAVDVGSLITKTSKLTLAWSWCSSQQDPSTLGTKGASLPTHGHHAQSNTHTLVIQCKARVCASIITVTPKVIDLGECSVGDFRSAIFSINNMSDLPALVLPFVESETLGVVDAEVSIPPRQTRQIRLEYVARVENTDYRRTASFFNAYNTYCNVQVEVKAKNVDTHQVLLHSLFYKLITHNTKRQLQIDMGNVLFNSPNLRLFSVRNTHSENLRLEITAISNIPGEDGEDSDIRIFLVTSAHKQPRANPSSSALEFPVDEGRLQTIEQLKWGGGPDRKTNHFSSGRRMSSGASGPTSYDDGMGGSFKGTSTGTEGDSSTALSSVDAIDMKRALRPLFSTAGEFFAIEDRPSDGIIEESRTKSSEQSSSIGLDGIETDGSASALIAKYDNPEYPFSLIGMRYLGDNLDGKDGEADMDKPLQGSLARGGASVGQQASTVPTTDDSVRLIQRSCKELAELVSPTLLVDEEKKRSSILVPLEAGQVTIPYGKLYDFVLVISPTAPNTAKSDNAAVKLTKLLKLRLLSVDSEDVNEMLNKQPGSTPSKQALSPPRASSTLMKSSSAEPRGEPLKPRLVFVRAKAFRSEIAVLQKNISFGRTIVGETGSKGITIANRSTIPCLYSIIKSGSIASGFLRIPSGRQGRLLPPLSSHTIDILFKPALAGMFEETLVIENILDPSNTQSISIRARVSKPETFQLLPIKAQGHEEKRSVGGNFISLPTPSEEEQEAFSPALFNPAADPGASAVSMVPAASPTRSSSGSLSAIPTGPPGSPSISTGTLVPTNSTSNAAPNSSSTSDPRQEGALVTPFFLGNLAVGEMSQHVIAFMIANVTTKSRHFIVDASHGDPVTLVHTKNNTTFEPIPETMQSIVELRCKFEQFIFSSGQAKASTQAQAARKELQDRLEHYEQKLKIGVRKQKLDKIEKYEKKIQQVLAALSGSSGLESLPIGGESDDEEKEGKEKKEKTKTAENDAKEGKKKGDNEKSKEKSDDGSKDAPAPSSPTSSSVSSSQGMNEDAVLKPSSSSQSLQSKDPIEEEPKPVSILGESDVAYHFVLEPQQSTVIHVTITLLPGMSYCSWTRPLPFRGTLRIFESKNEDLIKHVTFHAMVSSIKSQLFLPQRVKGSGSKTDLKSTSTASSVPSATIPGLYGSAASPAVAESDPNLFIVTVEKWSSCPTRQILQVFPEFSIDNAPKRAFLPMAIKLISVKQSQMDLATPPINTTESIVASTPGKPQGANAIMCGAFTVSSMIPTTAHITISLVDQSVDIASPNPSSNAASGSTMGLDLPPVPQMVYSEQLHGPLCITFGELMPSIFTPAPGAQLTSISGDVVSKLNAGQKLDCSLCWSPPQGLQHNSISGTLCVSMSLAHPSGTSEPVIMKQYIPFCCFLELRSSFSIDKYVNFGEVPIGSPKAASVVLANRSTTDDLHYVAMVVTVAKNSRTIGQVEIKSKHTGVLAPLAILDLTLEFSATSLGRFEQFLWVSNLNDRTDQNRCVLFANAILSQSRFVTFPDLDLDESAVGGKLRHLDLGLIQILPPKESGGNALVSVHPSPEDFKYKLRVKNVSDKALTVTAVSNLKSQLLIFADAKCSLPAVECMLAKGSITTLHVLIRPSNLEAKPGAAAKDKRKKGEGRELLGGIRLVFFNGEADESGETLNATLSLPGAEAAPKLFEISVAIRAIVGFSVLRLKHLTPSQHWCKSESGSKATTDGWHFVRGWILLENLSPTFPLRYQYYDGSDSSSSDQTRLSMIKLAAPASLSASSTIKEKDQAYLPFLQAIIDKINRSKKPSEREFSRGIMQMAVVDGHTECSLAPLEKRSVQYCAAYRIKAGLFGLINKTLSIHNVDTGDTQQLHLSVLFDQQRLALCHPVKPSLHDGDAQRSHPPALSPTIDLTPSSIDISSLDTCFAPIWLEPLSRADGKTSSKKAFCVISPPTDIVLAQWSVKNKSSRAFTVIPVSNRPVLVSVFTPNRPDAGLMLPAPSSHGSGNDNHDENAPSDTRLKNSERMSPIPTTPPLILWNTLVICGQPITILPQQEVVVAMTAALCAEAQFGRDEWDGSKSGLDGMESGYLHHAVCVIAFVPSTEIRSFANQEALSATFLPLPKVPSLSIFDPPGTASRSSSTGPHSVPSGYSEMPLRPITTYTMINCAFVIPKIRILNSLFDLGNIRCGRSGSFEIVIENVCDVDIPIALRGLPDWIQLSCATSNYAHTSAELCSTENGHGAVSLTIEADSAVVIASCAGQERSPSPSSIVPARSTLTIPLQVVGGRSSIPQVVTLEHKFQVVVVADSSSTTAATHADSAFGTAAPLTHTPSSSLIDVTVVLSVDSTESIELILPSSALTLDEVGKDASLVSFAGSSKRYQIDLIDSLTVPPPPRPLSRHAGSDSMTATPKDDLKRSVENAAASGMAAGLGSTQAKLEVKNTFSSSIRVSLSVQVSKKLARLLELHLVSVSSTGVKSKSQDADLHLSKNDTAGVQVVASTKMGTRLNEVLSDEELESVFEVHTGTSEIEPTSMPVASTENTAESDLSANPDSSPASGGTRRMHFGSILCRSYQHEEVSAPSTTPLRIDSSASDRCCLDEYTVLIYGQLLPGPTLVISTYRDTSGTVVRTAGSPVPERVAAVSVKDHEEGSNSLELTLSSAIGNATGALQEAALVFCARSPIQATSGDSQPRGPLLSLDDSRCFITIFNPSLTRSAAFRLSSESIRHSGMRLLLDYGFEENASGSSSNRELQSQNPGGGNDRENDSVGHTAHTYDTIAAAFYPDRGILQPNEHCRISVQLCPGLARAAISASAVEINSANPNPNPASAHPVHIPDGFILVGCIPIEIYDDEAASHPPVCTVAMLCTNVTLPILLTAPITQVTDLAKKRPANNAVSGNAGGGIGSSDRDDGNKVALGSIVSNSTNPSTENGLFPNPSDKNNSSLPYLTKSLLLRGVTPCLPYHGHYEIPLGQQVQRKELVEWILTIDNCSEELVSFSLSHAESSDSEWVVLGQTRGEVAPSSSISTMIYLSRMHTGHFFSYLLVENLRRKDDIYVIRISMEVVQDLKRRGLTQSVLPASVASTQSGSETLQELRFRLVCSSTHQSVHRSTQLTPSDKLSLRYGDVFTGWIYRTASLNIVNTSQGPLEFSLSTTQPGQILLPTISSAPAYAGNFTALAPASMLLLPQEQRVIRVLYFPHAGHSGTESIPRATGLDSAVATQQSVSGSHGNSYRVDELMCLLGGDRKSPAGDRVDLGPAEVEVGEIVVSCRLWQNSGRQREKSVRVMAVQRMPQLGVILSTRKQISGHAAMESDALIVPASTTSSTPSHIFLGRTIPCIAPAESVNPMSLSFASMSTLPTSSFSKKDLCNLWWSSDTLVVQNLHPCTWSHVSLFTLMQSCRVKVLGVITSTGSLSPVCLNDSANGAAAANSPPLFHRDELYCHAGIIPSVSIPPGAQGVFLIEPNSEASPYHWVDEGFLLAEADAESVAGTEIAAIAVANGGVEQDGEIKLASQSEPEQQVAAPWLASSPPPLEGYEHLTLYNRVDLSEAYVVPIARFDQISRDSIQQDSSSGPGQGGNSSRFLLTFSALEGSMTAFFRLFTYTWDSILAGVDKAQEECRDGSPDPAAGSTESEGQDKSKPPLVPENKKSQRSERACSTLMHSGCLVVTDSEILLASDIIQGIERSDLMVDKKLHPSIPPLASRVADVFFLFHALTKELQSLAAHHRSATTRPLATNGASGGAAHSSGTGSNEKDPSDGSNSSSTSAQSLHTSDPSECLATLFFTMVFRHDVFTTLMGRGADSGSSSGLAGFGSSGSGQGSKESIRSGHDVDALLQAGSEVVLETAVGHEAMPTTGRISPTIPDPSLPPLLRPFVHVFAQFLRNAVETHGRAPEPLMKLRERLEA